MSCPIGSIRVALQGWPDVRYVPADSFENEAAPERPHRAKSGPKRDASGGPCWDCAAATATLISQRDCLAVPVGDTCYWARIACSSGSNNDDNTLRGLIRSASVYPSNTARNA